MKNSNYYGIFDPYSSSIFIITESQFNVLKSIEYIYSINLDDQYEIDDVYSGLSDGTLAALYDYASYYYTALDDL